jgi:DHA1 family bicyclomycin/chloramphenicol resistance-like MFS transporter
MRLSEHRSAHLRRKPSDRTLIVLIGFYLMLQGVSTDIYLASLPGLARTFSASAATVQLTLSVFVLVFGAMQLVLGPLSDRVGRYPVLVGGLALYTLSSAMAVLAPSIEALIVARAFQAVGCCAVVVAARAIIRDVYSPTKGAHALAQASTILGMGPLIGPLIGSFLEVRYGFRGVFVVMAALAGGILTATWLRMAETNCAPDAHALRPRALLASYAEVLRSPHFRAHALVGAASYGTLFAFISGSPFVLISVLGVPTAWFGLCFSTCVAGYLVGTVVCRTLLARYGITGALKRASALSLGSGTVMAGLAVAGVHHWAAVLLPMIVGFAAHGINFPCAQAGGIAPFARLAGAAAGLYGFLMMAFAALLGAVIGASLNGTVFPMVLAIAGCSLILFVAAHWGVAMLPPPTS